jgi:hypothetical protein
MRLTGSTYTSRTETKRVPHLASKEASRESSSADFEQLFLDRGSRRAARPVQMGAQNEQKRKFITSSNKKIM